MLSADDAVHRRKGIALVTLATLLFAVLDASAKWLVQSLPPIEVAWLRFVTHVVLMAALLAPTQGAALLRVASVKLQALRAAMLGAMTLLNFLALQHLQLAETGAIQFSVPILIALISAAFLGQRLDPWRWAAIVGGFAGVLLVVRPGSAAFHPAIVLSLLNALIYAAFNLLTRRMAASETPQSMQWFSALGAAVLLAPFALAQWVWPQGLLAWALVLLTGLAGGLGHLFVAMAHRHAGAHVLAPFLYQQIVYMALLGWLVFAQVPDGFVVAGAAVVVTSGLYLLWLEVKHR